MRSSLPLLALVLTSALLFAEWAGGLPWTMPAGWQLASFQTDT